MPVAAASTVCHWRCGGRTGARWRSIAPWGSRLWALFAITTAWARTRCAWSARSSHRAPGRELAETSGVRRAALLGAAADRQEELFQHLLELHRVAGELAQLALELFRGGSRERAAGAGPHAVGQPLVEQLESFVGVFEALGIHGSLLLGQLDGVGGQQLDLARVELGRESGHRAVAVRDALADLVAVAALDVGRRGQIEIGVEADRTPVPLAVRAMAARAVAAVELGRLARRLGPAGAAPQVEQRRRQQQTRPRPAAKGAHPGAASSRTQRGPRERPPSLSTWSTIWRISRSVSSGWAGIDPRTPSRITTCMLPASPPCFHMSSMRSFKGLAMPSGVLPLPSMPWQLAQCLR